jgi:hypothetical protein
MDDGLPPHPPNSSDTILTVEIISRDTLDPANTRSILLPLLGRQFYAGSTLRSDAFEAVIGAIEVRHDLLSGGELMLHVQQQNPLNPAWGDTTVYEAEKIGITDTGFADIDIRISYGGGSCKFFLDAVCLTNPATYSLYYPNSPDSVNVQPGRRDQVISRFASLLLDENTPPSVYPNLRFIYGREQGPTDGSWATAYLCEKLIDSISAGQVEIHLPIGATWPGSEFSTEINRRVSSGCYYYPIDSTVHRPTLHSTIPSQYHHQLNIDTVRGLTEMSRVWRSVATKRKQTSAPRDWIPFIQNHSNMYDSLKYDDDPLREPTSAEIRQQCNLSLAHGADGVLFYSLISSPGLTSSPYWPRSLGEWEADTSGGTTRILDPRMGILSFVQDTLEIRSCDWNGENKWDSVSTYIQTFLRPIGDFVHKYLTWTDSKEWNLQQTPGLTGTNEHVSKVLSFRQDLPNPIDADDSTFVQITEFSDAETPYLLVLNGRTHPVEGHRHITVKLAGVAGDETQWMVTKILGEDKEGDIWIVRANAYPDTTTTANGFTDYFKPGSAALYRLNAIEDETVSFEGDCLGGNIYIEPAATLRTGSTDQLYFSPDYGLFAEGRLISQGTEFGPCDLEEYWEGIYSKGSDSVYLDNVSIINAGVLVGADGMAVLTEASEISNTKAAFSLTDGELNSSSTRSTDVLYHLWSNGDGISVLDCDSSDASGQPGSTALYVAYGASCFVEESRFQNFYRGVYARDGMVTGDADGSVPGANGNNKFDCNRYGLTAVRGGDIGLGFDSSWADWTASNAIVLPDSTYSQATTDGSSVIYARQNWWEPVTKPPSVNYSGNVYYLDMLTTNPIPFVSIGGGQLSKSSHSTFSPSSRAGFRLQLDAAARMTTTGTLRHLIGQFISSTSATTAEYTQLRYMYRQARKAGLTGCLDSLMTLCLTRQDVESKLLASDMCSRDKRYSDALDILNSYSFAGSTALLTRSLVRKSILYPLAKQGGYIDGLMALDTLTQLAATDSSLLHFIHIYPLLYSGLSHPAQLSLAPKESHTHVMDQVIPNGIELGQNYPNPFRNVTSFTFKLGEQTHVRLSVYDAMGREVAVVTDSEYGRGVHSTVLRSTHLPSGLYFYRFMTKKGVLQRKMLLLR